MQPAFCPPASYFRLFAATDLFIIYDDVQFNRRWYTHRQKFTNKISVKSWLTLPVKKSPRDATRICDLEWASDYQDRWLSELDKFTSFEHFALPDAATTPLMFLCGGLLNMLNALKIECKVALSSQIEVPDDLRGQDRIIAICKLIGAKEYVNSPGGKDMYDAKTFHDNGIKLTFLPEWEGSYDSVVERLTVETAAEIRKDIYEQI